MSTTLRNTVQITKALADRQRLRLMMLLRPGEVCACRLVETLGLAPSTVSRHLSLLCDAGLVQGRRQGRWTYYRWSDGVADGAHGALLSWLIAALADDEVVTGDAARVVRGPVSCREIPDQERSADGRRA